MSRLRSMCRTAFLYSGRRASDALIMGVFWAVRRVSSLTKWESGLGDGQAVLESGLGDGLADGQSLGLSLCCFGCYTGKQYIESGLMDGLGDGHIDLESGLGDGL